MLFEDTYKEIEHDSIGLYKEKGSKFIGYCYLVKNKNQVIEKLNSLKKKEKLANHYCYAYILKPDKSECKVSDDGEPSSTAGKPILNQIKSKNLTNILLFKFTKPAIKTEDKNPTKYPPVGPII